MKANKLMKYLLAAGVLAMSCVGSAWAWGHHGYGGSRVYFGVGFGPGYWGAPYYSGYYPGYYSPPYAPYAAAPVIINQTPPVYVEQSAQPALAAPSAAPVAAQPQQYWYYCAASRSYYPYVKKCPAGWVKTLPQAPE